MINLGLIMAKCQEEKFISLKFLYPHLIFNDKNGSNKVILAGNEINFILLQ